MRRRFSYPSTQIGLALVLLTLVFLVSFYGIVAEQRLLRNSNADVELHLLQIQGMDQKRVKLQKVLDAYQANREQIRDFNQNFLKRKRERVLEISKFLEDQAKKHDIRLEGVRYGRRPVKDGLEIYSIDLPLLGRYRDIRQFIIAVEQSPLFLAVTRLTLADDTTQRGAVHMQLSLATYFEGEPL